MHRDPRDPYLLFRSHTRIGALALSDVSEIMRPLPIEPIAGAPGCVLGLAVVRGLPSPVIDAGRLLTESDAPHRVPATRFIALKLGARRACLAVDAVMDIRPVPWDQLQAPPPLLGASGSNPLGAVGALDRELLLVLHAARLVPESVWASMPSAGTPA